MKNMQDKFNTAIFYNENSSCNSCMMCVRSCEIKAVKFINNLPKIVDDYCVNCGQCYNNCSPHAIRYVDSTEHTKHLIKNNKVVIASLSPTWVSEFRGMTKATIIHILKRLGFTYVSETTLGAQQMINETMNHIEHGAPLTISSECPAIRSTVMKYYPHLVPYLAPVCSPTIAHAKLLRHHYGADVKVVGINSCVAEKSSFFSADQDINATLTFKELKKWMDESGLKYKGLAIQEELSFEPFDAECAHDYIFTTGTLLSKINRSKRDISFISFSGMDNATNTLDLIDINKLEKQTFVKLLACKDGCMSSSGSIKRGDNILKLLTFKDHYKTLFKDYPRAMDMVDVKAQYKAEKIDNIHDIDSVKINEVLNSIYTSPDGKVIDCGKCGYATCKEFAKGVVRGMTQRINCVPHYQNILRGNLTIMVKNLPYSTFIVNSRMGIVESNTMFLETLGITSSDNGRLTEHEVTHFVPFAADIKDMLESTKEYSEQDIIVRGKMLRVSMFKLQNGRYVCGIVRNMVSGDVLGDEIITKTRKVIRENIESVQQIAHLLGENASRTEALLNSMLDMHNINK